MKVIGLTGGFGTGKSTVASFFRGFGATVIDADRIAHDAIMKGAFAYLKVRRTFGDSILGRGQEIDRRKLAASVFGDRGRLTKLNSIIHPYVIRKIREGIASASPEDVVVIDAPLLVEAGLHSMVDSLVVVYAPKAKQVERCVKKFRINRMDVLKRIRSQIDMKKKIALGDHLIDNGGTRHGTKEQARKVWREIVWK